MTLTEMAEAYATTVSRTYLNGESTPSEVSEPFIDADRRDNFLAGARAILSCPEVVAMRETLADIRSECTHDKPNVDTVWCRDQAHAALAAFDKLTGGE